MIHRILVAAVVLGLSLAMPQAAGAQALESRLGGRAFYDPIQNITWLTDTNYAMTSGYHVTGLMDWDDANAWAASLVVGGITGWRLPTTRQPDATCSFQSADFSGGDNCTGSELGHMFYRVLGAVAHENIRTTHNDEYYHLFPGVESIGDYWSETVYAWSGTEYRTYTWSATLFSGPLVGSRNTAEAWYFYSALGSQGRKRIDLAAYAWVVHDGDVALIPATIPPVVTPTVPGGTYLSAQTVGFTTDEPATVYYTTGGSAPTTSSLVYVNPLLIAGTTTIQYFGVDTAGNESAVETVTYTIARGESVWAWGSNASGQLGDGTTNASLLPVHVTQLTDVTAVAGGGNWTVAVKSDGTVWAWGNNASGQLGNGTTTDSAAPVQVAGLSNVTAVAAGAGHTVALDGSGDVWAWGWNGNGQLGDGTTTIQRLTPVQVSQDSGLSNVTAVAAGRFHTVALDENGNVWQWGQSYSSNSYVPVQVSGLSNVTGVAAGYAYSVAVRSDGTVWAWGMSAWLGDGTGSYSPTPVQVLADGAHPLRNVVSVASGGVHTVALKRDGTVWAWGRNDSLQLGRVTPWIPGAWGEFPYRASGFPLEVSGVGNVTAVAAGSAHTVALRSDGTVWAWGAWAPWATGIPLETPVQMSGLADVVAVVAAGSDHSLAIVSAPIEPPLPIRLSYSTESGYGTDGVNPDRGTAQTSFTFKTVYTQPVNLPPPTRVDVCIDNACWGMSQDTGAVNPLLRDGNFANGEQYAFTTFLSVGAHICRFEASPDGTNVVTLPSIGDTAGPMVSDLVITTTTLPFGVQGAPYIGAPLLASGGTWPYTWSAPGLPAGFTIFPGTGVISSLSPAAGQYFFEVSVTDADGYVAVMQFGITINLYSTPPSVQPFNLRDLGTLSGGNQSFPSDINSSGQVVGYSSTQAGPDYHAFFWEPGTGQMTDLGTLGGLYSRALAINDAGLVIGESSTAADNYLHAFLWRPATGQKTDLTQPGDDFSDAWAINDVGQVVVRSGTVSPMEYRAYLYDARTGVPTNLGNLGGHPAYGTIATAINNSGHVVGYSATAAGPGWEYHAFLWTAADGMRDIDGLAGRESLAWDINDAGQVAGYFRTASGEQHAFLWTETTGIVDLTPLAGTTAYVASAINNSGQVAGYLSTTTANFSSARAFLHDAAHPMTDLGTLGGPSTRFGGRMALNNSGQIVGYSYTADGFGRPFVYHNGEMKQITSPSPFWDYPIAAVAINDGGQIAGYASVAGGQIHSFVTMPAGQADVGVTVTASPAPAFVGEPVTLTAVVTNNGPDAASNVQFSGLDYVASVSSAISASTTQGVCRVPGDVGYAGTSVSCDLGTLGTQASNNTATITVIATLTSAVAAAPSGNSVNMNSDVSAAELDSITANNQFRGWFGANQRVADLAITASSNLATVAIGQPVTITATVANTGPDAATSVTLSMPSPVLTLQFENISITPDLGMCSPVVPGDPIQCSLGTVAANGSSTVTIVATPTEAVLGGPGSGLNQVSVGIPGTDVTASELDTIIANNHFRGAFGANQRQADVGVNVVVSPTTVNVGQPVTITATVTNNGPDAATNVSLSLPIPGVLLLTGISVTSSQGTCSPIVAGDPIACTLGTLAQNASATITIVATPTSALVSPGLSSSTVTIPAVVSATELDPVSTNNHFSNGFTVILPPGQFTDTGGVPLSFNTPQGVVTVTFSSVTQPGFFTNVTTTLIAPPLPAGFNLNGTFYEITTTAPALYTPPITVCFTGSFAAGDRIMHYEAGWVTLPGPPLPLTGPPFTTICAQTASLSPFAVASPVNHAPIANAGPNQIVEATSPTGAVVTLNGSGSDPDGDTLSFSWSGPCGSASSAVATLTCPIGVNSMTLTVSDGVNPPVTATVTITVQETKPPITGASICTTLGGKKLPDVDLFYFRGIKGETVTLRLDPNPSGTYTGGRAALLLFGYGLLKADTSNLPNVVTATLPKADTYFVTVSELLLKMGKFSGAYCVSLESSQNAWQTFTQK